MLRLIALALLLPLIAEAQLPDPQGPEPWKQRPTTLRMPPLKPADVAVSPAEHALRDLIPGWVPCRPLTEDEMAWSDSPHKMQGGSFYSPGRARGIPVVPHAWIEGWPEPGPLLATGVPRGWWWRPTGASKFGAWLVLGQGGRKGNHFFSMVTKPLRTVDHGSSGAARAARALYAALRDREAKRRGVDPAVLDAESERLAHGGYAAPPSVLAQAIEQAKALDRQDKLEEAAGLLEMTLDDGIGPEATRLRALVYLSNLIYMAGRYDDSRAPLVEARRLAVRLGGDKVMDRVDQRIRLLDETADAPAYLGELVRGTYSFDRENWPGVVSRLRAVLPKLADAPPDALAARWRLAVALDETGDTAGALAEATRALALAERLDDDEVAGRMTLMVKRLSAEGPTERGR